MAAMLRDSVVVVVVCTRPQAMPLAMMTMRKSTHGFPFLFSMVMGLRLAALRASGAPLLSQVNGITMSGQWITNTTSQVIVVDFKNHQKGFLH